MVSEGTSISEEAIGWIGSPGIYTERMAEAWKPVVDAVHKQHGVIFLQLWHCGRASHSSFHQGKPAVAPSAIKPQVCPHFVPVFADKPKCRGL
jgi:2,4-dienoyl-CoA reductase-like NADH-dependent reductase (Old Yellow Enzyme family)